MQGTATKVLQPEQGHGPVARGGMGQETHERMVQRRQGIRERLRRKVYVYPAKAKSRSVEGKMILIRNIAIHLSL